MKKFVFAALAVTVMLAGGASKARADQSYPLKGTLTSKDWLAYGALFCWNASLDTTLTAGQRTLLSNLALQFLIAYDDAAFNNTNGYQQQINKIYLAFFDVQNNGSVGPNAVIDVTAFNTAFNQNSSTKFGLSASIGNSASSECWIAIWCVVYSYYAFLNPATTTPPVLVGP